MQPRRASAWLAAGLFALAGCSAGGDGDQGQAAPWFVERAVESGIDFEWVSGHAGRHYFPEIMGGGAALFDMDADGDLDAYLVQAGGILVPARERPGNVLFANRGDATFEDVSASSGADHQGFGMGVATGDIHGDGRIDLYVTNLRENVLLANRGDGRFEDVTRTSGTGDKTWSASAGFFDHDRDGDLDLFLVNYIYWSVADELTCYSKPHPEDYCSPKSYDTPAPDVLFENRGDGTFEDVSARAGLRTAFGNGLGVVFADFDVDGYEDVFVANDGMRNQLWRNLGDGRFRDDALSAGCAVDQDGLEKAGMGTAAADYDDDGDEDLLVVNLNGEPDSFFRNDRTHFSDRTPVVGLAGASRPFTRFGLGFADFDNDGVLDLYEANGRVTRAPDDFGPRPFDQANLLFRGTADGRFEEVLPRGGTAPVLAATSRAAAFGDVDGDGTVDLLVVNRDGAAHLLLNQAGRGGEWIVLRVTESNRDALGAEVTLSLGQRRILRRVRSAFSYCSASDARVHVGLGAATRVEDVQVRWADGLREAFGGFDAGQVVELVRGGGRPVTD